MNNSFSNSDWRSEDAGLQFRYCRSLSAPLKPHSGLNADATVYSAVPTACRVRREQGEWGGFSAQAGVGVKTL